ncbi:hypothetical protein F01_310083 [Burkholderia cenocepacia]|nr:hypothetical protein F01_310083 [Burkholderia cenocepacia]
MPAFSLCVSAVHSVIERVTHGAALPARGELRFERFAALPAAPGRRARRRAVRRGVEEPAGECVVTFVVEPQLGCARIGRQAAERAGRVAVVQFATDAGYLEHVGPMLRGREVGCLETHRGSCR